jgi:hypothetical protein
MEPLDSEADLLAHAPARVVRQSPQGGQGGVEQEG